MWYEKLLEKNLVPDAVIRRFIRYYNQSHLDRLYSGTSIQQESRKQEVWRFMVESKQLAHDTEAANEQHYEVPAAFYTSVLGPHLKYSCGYWKPGATLASSELEMLETTCLRAQLKDGQNVLELGCGWGSLSLYMAQQYPSSSFTVISNSQSQRVYIQRQAEARELTNLTVLTVDINEFKPEQTFERIVSVEMFEHIRNYEGLFERINTWLKPSGLLFVHIFAHKKHPYLFLDEHPRDWMARYFFTGGTMPSIDTLPYFAHQLEVHRQWWVNGKHYEQTSNAWLEKMDLNKDILYPLFESTYGEYQASKWWVYWRIFFMACAELFGHAKGEEWGVVHTLFKKTA